MFKGLVHREVIFPFAFFSLWAACNAEICGPVEPGGVTTCGEFTGRKNATPANVRYTGTVNVSTSCPNWPFTNYECTDSAFAFSCRFTSARVL